MIAIGTLVSVLAMELELAQGLMHYMLYFVLTFILAWLAGAQLGGPLNNNNVSPNLPRQNDAMPPATQPTAPEPDQEARPTIPNLLQ